MKPEYIALTVNLITLVWFLWQSPLEPGKVIYWAGAVLITVGLSMMKG